MSNELAIMLMFACLIAGIAFAGGHLGFVMAAIAIVFGLIEMGEQVFTLVIYKVFGIFTNYVIIAVPMFVLMGNFLERAGFAEDLFGGIEVIFAKLRGGVATGTIILSTAFAMCTGVVAASVSTVGVMALPFMLRRGYSKPLAMGVLAAGGTLGILIPPSILIVFLAVITELSVGRLFLGAFFPGFLLASLYILYINILCMVRPHMAPADTKVAEMGPALPRILRAFRGIIPMTFIIFAVLGTIVFGIATPTEAAGAGAFGAFLVAVAYRRANWQNVKEGSLKTLEILGMIAGVVIGGMSFSTVFMNFGGSQIVKEFLLGLEVAPIVIVIVMMFIIFILGMFIDPFPIVLICLPVFLPVSRTLGFDDIWFGMLVCVCMQTAWLTPPFGFALFFLRGIAPPEVSYADIVLGCAPFVVLQVIGLGFCIAFPQIILFLPSLVYG